jgi:hypothetical protein
MRKGNSSYDRSTASYNPDKSYDMATWQDYVEWCGRLGHDVRWSKHHRVLTIVEEDGTEREFKTKQEVYEYLLGDEYV